MYEQAEGRSHELQRTYELQDEWKKRGDQLLYSVTKIPYSRKVFYKKKYFCFITDDPSVGSRQPTSWQRPGRYLSSMYFQDASNHTSSPDFSFASTL